MDMDPRKIRSRKALCDALLNLLQTRAFDQISIREITASAEIGYATFFRHYETKEDLLDDLAAEQIATLLAIALPVLYAEDTHAAAVTLCNYVNERHQLWSALLAGGAASNLRSEFIRQAQAIAQDHAGDPVGMLPNDLKVIYGVGGTVDILAWWLRQRSAYSPQQVAEFLDRLLITPVWSDQ